MSKLGVITDGISRDLEHALGVMQEVGLEYAELQFVWDKEVGDLTEEELSRAQALLSAHQIRVSCISRHNFAGMLLGATEVGDEKHRQHMDALRRCIATAKTLDCDLVRIMSFRREMILFGSGGAEDWNVSRGAWQKLIQHLAPAVQLAEDEQVTLVLETGNNAMITTGYLGRKLLDEMGSDRLKILWDPGNSLYSGEATYPDGYQALGVDAIGHIHIKDLNVDLPKASVHFREMGSGQMAPYFEPLAAALQRDGYLGGISLESVYRPADGDFEAGFRASFPTFHQYFG